MTSQYEKYHSPEITVPEKGLVWNMYGAGEENIGKDGKPEQLPIPQPAAHQMLVRIPPRRIDDVVVIDPSDVGHPIGLNPFYRVPPDERALVAANMVSTMKHIWRESWGARLEYILYNTVAAILDAPDHLRPSFLSIWTFPEIVEGLLI